MAQLAAYGLAFSARDLRDRPPMRAARSCVASAGRSSRHAPARGCCAGRSIGHGRSTKRLPEDTDGATVASLLRADADARAADADLDHAVIAALARGGPAAVPSGARCEVLIHGDPGALSAGLVGSGA